MDVNIATGADTAVWVCGIAVRLEVVGVWVAKAGVGTGSGTAAASAGSFVVGLVRNVGFLAVDNSSDD